MNAEDFDMNIPGVAERLGRELASNLLHTVAPGVMHAPLDARLRFFQAHLAVLVGGMQAALGERLAQGALDALREIMCVDSIERERKLH